MEPNSWDINNLKSKRRGGFNTFNFFFQVSPSYWYLKETSGTSFSSINLRLYFSPIKLINIKIEQLLLKYSWWIQSVKKYSKFISHSNSFFQCIHIPSHKPTQLFHQETENFGQQKNYTILSIEYFFSTYRWYLIRKWNFPSQQIQSYEYNLTKLQLRHITFSDSVQ